MQSILYFISEIEKVEFSDKKIPYSDEEKSLLQDSHYEEYIRNPKYEYDPEDDEFWTILVYNGYDAAYAYELALQTQFDSFEYEYTLANNTVKEKINDRIKSVSEKTRSKIDYHIKVYSEPSEYASQKHLDFLNVHRNLLNQVDHFVSSFETKGKNSRDIHKHTILKQPETCILLYSLYKFELIGKGIEQKDSAKFISGLTGYSEKQLRKDSFALLNENNLDLSNYSSVHFNTVIRNLKEIITHLEERRESL